MTPPATCVAIPVRDEADRIGACLSALSSQQGDAPDHVVLLVNNTADRTVQAVDSLRPSLRFPVTCAIRHYPPPQANAGVARAEAMRIAAGIAGPHGLLLTTDADGRVRPDWLGNTLRALSAGAEVVCGRAEIDPVEALAIPAALHEDDSREVAYATLVDRIHALADPDPFDPWPRHTEHAGASIAVSVSAWEQAGGVPALPNGEDRGFLRALRRIDRRIRHAPDVRVVVSGRTLGRAAGGMAETMARRMLCQDPFLDDALEPAADALRRATARAELRRLREAGDACARIAAFAEGLALPLRDVAPLLRRPFFGEAWDALERSSPALRRRPVPRDQLAAHHAAAERVVAGLLTDRTGHTPPLLAATPEPEPLG